MNFPKLILGSERADAKPLRGMREHGGNWFAYTPLPGIVWIMPPTSVNPNETLASAEAVTCGELQTGWNAKSAQENGPTSDPR